MLRRWDCRLGQVEGSSCRSEDTCVGSDVSGFQTLPGLRTLHLWWCPIIEDVTCIGAFSHLETLKCQRLFAVCELPDLSNFPRLMRLQVASCERRRRLAIRAPIHALSELKVIDCRSLMTLPDLSYFPGLVKLQLMGCEGLSTLSTSAPLTALERLEVGTYCRIACGMKELADLGTFPALKILSLEGCIKLKTLSCSGPLTALQVLELVNDSQGIGCGVQELPDLGMFPALKILSLKECIELTTLSCSGPLTALQVLELVNNYQEIGCGMKELPDLGMFPALKKLSLKGCIELTTLSCSGPLTALQVLQLVNNYQGIGCGVQELPDLGMFPALESLLLKGCFALMSLRSSVALPALRELNARGCTSLSQGDLDKLQALCPLCEIKCGALHVGVSTGHEKRWMWRAAGAGGIILALRWIVCYLRRSRVSKY